MFQVIKSTDKKKKTTGVKAGGGSLGEENILDVKKQSTADMLDRAALGVNIIVHCKSRPKLSGSLSHLSYHSYLNM